MEIKEFERHLININLSKNTVISYLNTIKQYMKIYGNVTKKKLSEYKLWLIENYSPKTVNLRIRGINCYLEFVGKEKWKM